MIKLKKKLCYQIALFIGVGLITFTSCNSTKSAHAVDPVAKTEDVKNQKLIIDSKNVKSIDIVWSNQEDKKVSIAAVPDQDKLIKYLQSSEYDTKWNDKDIMLKMVAPDYTVVVNYKDKPVDDSDWIMIWKENNKVKFKNTWYVIPSKVSADVYKLLDKY